MTMTSSPRAGAAPADRQLVAGTALMGLLVALTLAGLATDPRLLDGANVWMKPAKFAASVGLHLATLAFFASRLSPEMRLGPAMRIAVPVLLLCTIFEMGYIILQAAAREHSHFNTADAFHAAMYTAMGIGAVILTAGAALLALLIARDRGADLTPGLRLGAILGLSGGTVLTILVAGYMGGNGGHFTGIHPEGGATVPLLGWSLETGDLRPAHFLALHMMQAMPLAGLALDRWRPGAATGAVPWVAAMWVALTLGAFALALAGRPLPV